MIPPMSPDDDPTELELQHAILIDSLGEEFRAALGSDPSLSAEAFADAHPEVPRELLVPVLQSLGALARTRRVQEGPFAPGDRVGPYRVDSVLGRGGMGIVYGAVEEGLGRMVALKCMNAGGDERFRLRFEREARAAARLDHPGIVPVFGSGETDGVLWYAMRRVDGEALDKLLGQLPPVEASGVSSASGHALSPAQTRAVTVALRLSEALAYAHTMGVLHRDVKPGNVIVEADGTPLLTDFGLCKVEGDASLTQDTDLVGTLRYMPPEALEGETDARGDVYGVGLLAVELLTGQPAFESNERRAMIHSLLHLDPIPLRGRSQAAGGPISGDVERVVRKAVAKRPDERYANAAELADDLRALLEGQPVRARPTSALYLAQLFVRRNRALSVALLALVLGLAAGVSAYVVQLRSSNAKIREARDLAQARAADASLSNAVATLQVGDTGGAAGALLGVEEDRRSWMWRHMSLRVGLDAKRVASGVDGAPKLVAAGDRAALTTGLRVQMLVPSGGQDPPFEASGDLSPGGGLVAGVLGQSGTLYYISNSPRALMRWSGNERDDPIQLCDLPDRANELAVDEAENSVLVLDGFNGLVMLELAKDEAVELWRRSVPVNRVSALGVGSRERYWLGSTGGQVIVGGPPETDFEVVTTHYGMVRALMVEGGELMASGGAEGQFDMEHGLTGHGRVRVRLDSAVFAIARVSGGPRDPSATPGPELVAVATGAQVVALVDVHSGVVTRRISGLRAEPTGLWCLTGGLVVAAARDGDLTFAPRAAHDGRLELSGALGLCRTPFSTADGRWLAFDSDDSQAHFIDLEAGRIVNAPTGDGPSQRQPTIDAVRKLGFAGADVLDLDTGRVLGRLPVVGKPVRRTACFADGSLLAVCDRERPDGQIATAGWHFPAAGARDAWASAEPREASVIPGTGRAAQLIASPKETRAWLLDQGGGVSSVDPAAMTASWTTAVPGRPVEIALGHGGMELFAAGRDGQVRVLDAVTGELLEERTWRAAEAYSDRGTLTSVCRGPVPGTVVTCTFMGRVDLWSAKSGRRLGTLASGDTFFRSVGHVGNTGWIAATGGFGRVVLFGAEDPLLTVGAVDGLFGEGASGVARRLEEVAIWASEDLRGAQGTARGAARALERSFRFRATPWLRAAKERLGRMAEGLPPADDPAR